MGDGIKRIFDRQPTGHGLVRADLAYHSNFIEYNNLVYLQNNLMDSSFNDIGRSNGGGIEAFAQECLANPTCRGFNSNGWVKHTIRPRSVWYKWTEDPTKGLYVRKSASPSPVEYNDLVYLQNNFMDNRWLSGARSGGNADAITRDHFSNQYERYTVATSYQWIVRKKNSGDGSRP